MKLITNFFLGIGVIFLIVGIFNPVSNIHFGNVGLIVLIIGICILFVRFITERNYKGSLLVVIAITIICIAWKLPIIKTSFLQSSCFEGDCVFETIPTGIQYITLKDWIVQKTGSILFKENCGIVGCQHLDNSKAEVTF